MIDCLYLPHLKAVIIPVEDVRQKEWDQIKEKLKPEGYQFLTWPKAEIEKVKWMIIQNEAEESIKRTLSTPEAIEAIQRLAELKQRKEASFEQKSTGKEI